MTESEFQALVDDTLLGIEDVLDEAETDLDYMTVGGVLTVHCENGCQIIFTRQAPVLQLWVATPGGGYHFDYDSENARWVSDSDASPLAEFLAEAFSKFAGESFQFSC